MGKFNVGDKVRFNKQAFELLDNKDTDKEIHTILELDIKFKNGSIYFIDKMNADSKKYESYHEGYLDFVESSYTQFINFITKLEDKLCLKKEIT